jgi:hypothetical protein
MLKFGILFLTIATSAGPSSPFATLLCDANGFSETEQLKFHPVEVAGVYRRSFEVAAFTPDESTEEWWVASAALNALMNEKGLLEIRVVLSGKLSPEGNYGHLGAYHYCLAEPKIVKVLTVDE